LPDRIRLRADQPAHDRRPGHEDDVVLIRAAEALSLDAEDADDLAGHVLDADLLAENRRSRHEELVHHGLPEEAHLGRGHVLLAAERLAFRDGPGPHLKIGGRRPLHLREPVLVAVDDLPARPVDGRDRSDGIAQLALDGRGVVPSQVLRRAGPGSDAVHGDRSGQDHQQIGPQALHLLSHLRLRALTDGDGGHHRGHGDDDPQHREQ